MITVTLLHPTVEGRTLTLELPRQTRFSQLTDMLYERDFVQRQKPGYRYLYQDHLCGMAHELGDYIPETASRMELKVFDLPVIMV